MVRHALAAACPPGGLRHLAVRLRSGETTPVDVLDASLRRIKQVDAHVGAFTWLSPTAEQEAEELGRELAQGRWRGPLHGVPVGVKELFDVAGAPCAYGSKVLDEAIRADVDAEIVKRLRDSGAIIVGTTRSHEFGWGITTQHPTRGSTRNPWDLDRVPGGSSGGSAAAVAAGMVPLAIASDTGGSIRIPAAFCGVAGIKPSYGRIPKSGAVPLAPSLDTPGFIASSVVDLIDALMATSGVDPDDPVTVIADLTALSQGRAGGLRTEPDRSLKGVRLGFSPDLFELTSRTSRTTDYETLLEQADIQGAHLVQLSLPRAAEFRAAFAVIQMADAVTVHRELLDTYPKFADRYGQDVRGRLDAASSLTISDLLKAVAQARDLHARLLAGLHAVDGLLSPISTVAPPLVTEPDEAALDDQAISLREAVMGFTTPQNLAGLPAVAFPFLTSSDGLPVGFQITATKGAELDALHIAAQLERQPIAPGPTHEGDYPCQR